jgi:hypothetical protein
MNGLLNFHSAYKRLLSYLKQPSFLPLADVETMSNDLVYAMPWQSMHMIALSICAPSSLWHGNF